MMIQKMRKPLLAVCFSFYLLCIFSSPAVAGMIGSVSSPEASGQVLRGTEINKIQRALETEIVKEKLNAYGLTSDEINQKLQGMTDEQIHMLAQASDDILAGADDGLGILIAILIIVLLVILILKLTGHSVFVH
jgi:hypothetical protein